MSSFVSREAGIPVCLGLGSGLGCRTPRPVRFIGHVEGGFGGPAHNLLGALYFVGTQRSAVGFRRVPLGGRRVGDVRAQEDQARSARVTVSRLQSLPYGNQIVSITNVQHLPTIRFEAPADVIRECK